MMVVEGGWRRVGGGGRVAEGGWWRVVGGGGWVVKVLMVVVGVVESGFL